MNVGVGSYGLQRATLHTGLSRHSMSSALPSTSFTLYAPLDHPSLCPSTLPLTQARTRPRGCPPPTPTTAAWRGRTGSERSPAGRGSCSSRRSRTSGARRRRWRGGEGSCQSLGITGAGSRGRGTGRRCSSMPRVPGPNAAWWSYGRQQQQELRSLGFPVSAGARRSMSRTAVGAGP